MTDHTPEPWEAYGLRGRARIDNCSGVRVYRDSEPVTVAITDDDLLLSVEEQEANAARIVACVNACAGIPTEQLGNVRALVEGLEGMLHFFMGYSDMEPWKKADAALAPFREASL